MKKHRRIIAILLTMILTLSFGMEVFASDSFQAAKPNAGGSGSISTVFYAVRLREVSGGSGTTESSVYMSNVYGKYPDDMFSPSFMDNTVIVWGKAGYGGLKTKTYYNYDGLSMCQVNPGQILDVSGVSNPGTAYKNYMKDHLIPFLVGGGNYNTALSASSDIITAGTYAYKLIYDSQFASMCSELMALFPNNSAEVYGAILLTLYASSGGYINKSMIDTYFTYNNENNSSSYIYVDIVVLAGDNSTPAHQLFTYQSFWAYMYQVNASSLCFNNPNIVFSGFQGDRARYYMNSLSAILNGRGIVNDIRKNATYFFGYNWKANGAVGSASAENGGVMDMSVQVSQSTGQPDGQTGITHLSRSLTGTIVSYGEGNIRLVANPKNSSYSGAGTVQAEILITCKTSEENKNTLLTHGSSAKLTLNVSSEVIEGSCTNDSKLVNDKSHNVLNSNTQTSAKFTIQLSSTGTQSLTNWLNGAENCGLAIVDSGITPDINNGVKIKYSVTGTLAFPDGYTATLTSSGVGGVGTTTAYDVANWNGKYEVFEYHSSDGTGRAYGEVKSNEPNLEQWEAMGGIPTTENVYVVAGGQAFQVDMKGQVKENPATYRTVTINVTTTDNWGDDTPCTAVCTGHSHTHAGHEISPAVPPDPITGLGGSPAVVCGGADASTSFAGNESQDWSWSADCGESDSGTDTHGDVGTSHKSHWSGGVYGDSCSNSWNAYHRQSVTYTYKILIPIDAFTYFDMMALNVDYLDGMTFSGNSSLFNNPNASVNNNQSTVAYYDKENYSSGNGRLCFDSGNACNSVAGNNLKTQCWGDITINVTTQAGSNVVGGSYSEDGEFPGATDATARVGATEIANDIVSQMNVTYVCTIVSDYAEIEQGGGYQTINYYEQNSIPAKWFDGIAFTEPGQTLTSSNGIKWSYTADSNNVFYNNPYRTLTGAESVMRVGYNGEYYSVYNDGTMSGKFGMRGTFTDSRYNKWVNGYTQPNAMKKVFNNNTVNSVPMVKSGIDIKDTYPNGRVDTGTLRLNYKDGVAIGTAGTGGYARCNSVTCIYKDGDSSVNAIVIHDPVSVEYCELISLPASSDNRVDSSSIYYGGDLGATNVAPSGTFASVENGIAFINMGEKFKVKISNIGNFQDSPNTLGIAACTDTKCLGFINGMDCTKWTKNTFVLLPVSVKATMKDGSSNTYAAYEKIKLSDLKSVDGSNDTFEFLCLTNNYEAIKAQVTFYSEAINTPYTDSRDESNGVNNKIRTGLNAAKHTATKHQYIDVVGQIGNLTINDTGDFRFATLFKQELNNGRWLIPSLVPEVDYKKPNQIVSDPYDIINNKATAATKYHSTLGVTYASTGGKAYPFVSLPLSPSDNPITELRNQEMRPGYNLYMDIETMGNYYGENYDENMNPIHDNLRYRMVIIPRYWSYDLDTKQYTPVDVYYGVSGEYDLLLSFNRDKTYNSEWIYYMNWKEESARRNYTSAEKSATTLVSDYYSTVLGGTVGDEGNYVWKTKTIETPANIETVDRIGTAASLFLDMQNRTFIGSTKLYGESQVVGSKTVSSDNSNEFSNARFTRQSQRWNFTIGLPSSSVFVEAGRPCTETNIAALQSDRKVIVCTLDIKVQGEIWAIEYDGTAVNFSDSTKGYEIYPGVYALPPKESDGTYIDDPIVCIYNSTYTSEDDLRTEGTH